MNKKELLKRLYNKDNYKLKVYLKNDKGINIFDVTLKDFNGYDCKIGSFGYNYWFRTNKGINKKKYTSFNHLLNGIRQTSRNKGFKLIGYEIRLNRRLFHKRIIKQVIFDEEYKSEFWNIKEFNSLNSV